jgi:hypothetical protein
LHAGTIGPGHEESKGAENIWKDPIWREKFFLTRKYLIKNETAKEMFAKIWRKTPKIWKNLRKSRGNRPLSR